MRIAFPGALRPQMSAIVLSFGLAATGARLSRHCDVPTLVKGLPFTAGRALHCRLSHTLNVTGLMTGYTSLQSDSCIYVGPTLLALCARVANPHVGLNYTSVDNTPFSPGK